MKSVLYFWLVTFFLICDLKDKGINNNHKPVNEHVMYKDVSCDNTTEDGMELYRIIFICY